MYCLRMTHYRQLPWKTRCGHHVPSFCNTTWISLQVGCPAGNFRHLQAYWRTFLREEWDNHASQVGTIPQWDFRRVQQFKGLLDGWVLTPADHFFHDLHMTCPQHYDFLLRRTFEDPTIFTQCCNPSIFIRSKIRENFPKCLTEYIWAVTWHGRLPGAYMLPKPSKSSSKARPIITSAGSC